MGCQPLHSGISDLAPPCTPNERQNWHCCFFHAELKPKEVSVSITKSTSLGKPGLLGDCPVPFKAIAIFRSLNMCI